MSLGQNYLFPKGHGKIVSPWSLLLWEICKFPLSLPINHRLL